MPQIQDLIHKLEEGEGTRYLKVLFALLAVAALAVWYDLREYKNFATVEAMEAAQLARNLARGEGFTTQSVRPLTLHLVLQAQGTGATLSRAPHPDLFTPPVYPLLLAGLMKVLPFRYEVAPAAAFMRYQPEMLIALFNQVLFAVAVALAFGLARRLLDATAAWLTAAVLVGCELLWRFSVSGLSTMWLLVLVLALAWVLVWLEQAAREETAPAGSAGSAAAPAPAEAVGVGVGVRRSTLWFAGMAVLTGLLLGLGGLTRYAFAWLLLPTLAFTLAYLGRRRLVVSGLVLAVFLAVFVPWLVRNHQVSGTFFGVAGYAVQQDSVWFPDTRLERSLGPDMTKFELSDYTRKLLVNLADICQNELPRLGGSWLTAFFLVGLLLPFRNPALGRLRNFTLLSVVVLAVAQALGRTHLTAAAPGVNSENYLVLLVPLVFLFGVSLFLVLLDQIEFPFAELRRTVTIGFGVAMSGALIFALLPPRSYPLAYPPYYPPVLQEAARLFQPKELIMSDMPWAVAWYGDRRALWTTLSVERDFDQVNLVHSPVNGLLLTPLSIDARFLSQMLQNPDWAWGRFVLESIERGNIPDNFPLKYSTRGYLPNWLVLADRDRWKSADRPPAP